jgi:branched-chain amino acid transport system ATP-binding protein
MLQLDNISASYDGIRALNGVSLEVGPRESVAVLGANGAGKSTLLKVISGLTPAAGEISWEAQSLAGWPAHRIARAGILSVPEGRRIFPGLTVEENLVTAVFARSRAELTADLEQVFSWLPWMSDRRKQLGWSLSGGQQQMLAIGRALMANPDLLILDEPSEGLAPVIVDNLAHILGELALTGVAILLIEQHLKLVNEICERFYVISKGAVRDEGRMRDVTREQLQSKIMH